MTNKEVTIYDIAEALELSASTVSRALKENKRVSQKTIDKVHAYANKVGYQTNTFASNLRSGETKTIGVVVPHLNSRFISSCIAGAEKVAQEKGYSLLISQSLENIDKEKMNIDSMFRKRVDGLLLSTVDRSNDMNHLNAYINKGIPVLCFDRVSKKADLPKIQIDNIQAAERATKHLIDMGCKHILHISLESNSSVYNDRELGFIRAIDSENSVTGFVKQAKKLNIDEGRTIARSIEGGTVDGIFVANDQAAIGCMLELQKMGIKIPDDIALVGFNDDPISDALSPALSSIRYPSYEMGTLMANSLIEHMLGNSDITLTKETTLNSELIIRESSQKI